MLSSYIHKKECVLACEDAQSLPRVAILSAGMPILAVVQRKTVDTVGGGGRQYKVGRGWQGQAVQSGQLMVGTGKTERCSTWW